ncbi:hypothetical protein EST38_g4349 [Candolleomyces aberdarensis]|uniref:Nephrocystin 3-like N-terminal domain-containing protein n=1 Tax=Candolleomyces aberdarensis TaxID=2316362 RepID=A0A4Q2DPV0_9AGAR|nr:hypothetical protein EST38_g4349 [Candolleomyces aberdarensis]
MTPEAKESSSKPHSQVQWSKPHDIGQIPDRTPDDIDTLDVTTTVPPALFSNASKFVVHNLHVDASQQYHRNEFPSTSKGPGASKAGWKLLLDAAAPNALYNSADRFDPPKCDEGTRIEVVQEVMDWMHDRQSPQRLLCMTGAAGSGKSALQQTISERCSEEGILGSTFFLSSTDPTRNTASALIATMAYQLGSDTVELRREMGTVVARDPLIFSKSLKTQMEKLIVAPFEYLRRNSEESELSSLPYAMLIDGLDECTDEERQAEVLSTINECLLKNKNMPFRIFIASRPEWAIRSALEEDGYLHQVAYHIPLSDKYDAFSDIERVFWRRLREIGRKSSDPRARSPSWPSKQDVAVLCRAASGQFIYAATVIKFVSDKRSSPVDKLQMVLNWTPNTNQRTKPFASLDRLYTNILLRAKEEYEASNTDGHDFLLLIRVYHLMYRGDWNWPFGVKALAWLLKLEENAHEKLLWDLRSLITTTPGTWVFSSIPDRYLRFYHKSFSDFLDDESRSKDLFVSEKRGEVHVAQLCLRHINEDTGDSRISDGDLSTSDSDSRMSETITMGWHHWIDWRQWIDG